jgi:hypothetical protein
MMMAHMEFPEILVLASQILQLLFDIHPRNERSQIRANT